MLLPFSKCQVEAVCFLEMLVTTRCATEQDWALQNKLCDVSECISDAVLSTGKYPMIKKNALFDTAC